MKDLDNNRIKKHFENQSSEDENFVADSFFNQDNEAALKQVAAEQWENAPTRPVDLQHVLNKIHFNINASKKEKSLSNRIVQFYYRVAAILLLPIIIAGALFWNSSNRAQVSFTELTAPKGSRVQFALPDGSTGYLNSGSTIRYATSFTSERQVELTGEGYFNVTKDKKHPFTVHTKYADIRVLGTSFDVCAYDTDNEVLTTLESGSVQIINKKNSLAANLNPGQQNRLNTKTGEMENLQVATHLYTSWKEDMLRFDNAPFVEVVKKMERWYGVKIILDESLHDSENYTMTIKTESLREMLQLLQITTPMKYTIENDVVKIQNPTKKK